jgi:hypothetical protein
MSQLPHAPDDPNRPSQSAHGVRRARVVVAWGVAAAALLIGLLHLATLWRSPSVPLLVAEQGAEWIFFDAPFKLGIYTRTNAIVGFRKKFQIESVPSQALLTLHGFRDANLRLDGNLLVESRRDGSRWRTPIVVDLAPHLTPGEHELFIKVQHFNGPPALLAYSKELQLVSDSSWEASVDGGRSWTPVRSADALRVTEQRERAMTGPQALREIAHRGWRSRRSPRSRSRHSARGVRAARAGRAGFQRPPGSAGACSAPGCC